MKNMLIRIITLTLAIIIVTYLFPVNMIHLEGEGSDKLLSAFFTAIILALVNLIIRPIVKVLTLPINILTLGLFSLIINAAMLWIVDHFVEGFSVFGFWGYFLGALAISIINSVLYKLLKDKQK